jgi:hypothetical protein
MMQNVIDSTRGRLMPFLRNAGFDIPEAPRMDVSHVEMGLDRFVKKVPTRNYKNLVPIKWL